MDSASQSAESFDGLGDGTCDFDLMTVDVARTLFPAARMTPLEIVQSKSSAPNGG